MPFDIMMTLVLLIGVHALADYPLQGEFLSREKNRTLPNHLIPWYHAMGAHAVIHGVFVSLITGVWWLGVFEAIAHFVIDDDKCLGKISFNTDQMLHIGCKLVWWLVTLSNTGV